MKTMWNFVVFRVWLTAVIFIVSAFSIQASKEIKDIENMSLEELLSVKVSVASKSKEVVGDAPSSVTVFTSDDIQRMGLSSLEELLDFVPGFHTSRDIEQGTTTRISVRGRSSALSESVLLLIDGQRINDLYTGGISILNRMIAVENIKQVEIIRGPGSALYGSNAFLGVINIITMEDWSRVRVNVGDMHNRAIAINYAGELSADFSFSSFVKVFSQEGMSYKNVTDIYGQNGQTSDPAKGVDAYLSVKYNKLTLNLRHMERTLRDFLTFGNLANNINYESSQQSSITGDYKWKINDRLQLDFGAGYMEDRWRVLSEIIPKDFEIAPGFALSETLVGGPDLSSYNANFSMDLNFHVSHYNRLSAGFSYMRTGISRVRNLFTHHPTTFEYQGHIVEWSGDASFNEEVAREVIGIYLQDKISFGKYLSVTGGVRFDHYNDFGSTINPRAAVVYSTSFGTKIKAMYGRAFRAPNFLELYDKNNPVDFGNPDLKPEKVETLEFAVMQNFKKFYVALTYFQNRITDIIMLGDVVIHPNNPLEARRFLNAGKATTRGLEFELKSTPLKNMMISGTFTHLYHGEHPYVPKNYASLIINYNTKRLNLNVNGIFRDKIEMLPLQNSYILVNGALQFSLSDHFKLLSSIRNLFDKEYLTVSSMLLEGVQNRRRTFTFGASFTF